MSGAGSLSHDGAPGREVASPQEKTDFDKDCTRQTVTSEAGVLDIDLSALGSHESGLAVCARGKGKSKRPVAEKNMILTYSTLILGSLIVAMLALFFYRLISHASKSASKARKRLNRADHIQNGQNTHTWRTAVSHVGNNGSAQTSPAMPTSGRSQNNVWPYRENKQSAVGSGYKVRRRTVENKPAANYARKPWGW